MTIKLSNGVVRFVGTVSHGTLRTEDLIEAFMEELWAIDEDMYRVCWKELQEVNATEDDYACDWLNERLFSALESYAPAGYYFGSHPGDGSDFGWWPE